MWVVVRSLPDLLPGCIPGSIVDKDQLVYNFFFFQQSCHTLCGDRNHRFLVVGRNDY